MYVYGCRPWQSQSPNTHFGVGTEATPVDNAISHAIGQNYRAEYDKRFCDRSVNKSLWFQSSEHKSTVQQFCHDKTEPRAVSGLLQRSGTSRCYRKTQLFFTSAPPTPEPVVMLVGLNHLGLPPRLTTPAVETSPPPPPRPPSCVESTRLEPDLGADSGVPTVGDVPLAIPPRKLRLLPPPRLRPLLAPPRLLMLLALLRLAPLPLPLFRVKWPLSGKARTRRRGLPIGPPEWLLLVHAARTFDAAFTSGVGEGGEKR